MKEKSDSTDWIIRHKDIYTRTLPSGFSIYVTVNVHQSGKISMRLNCSLLIGTLDFKKGLELDHSKLDGRILSKMSKVLGTKTYI